MEKQQILEPIILDLGKAKNKDIKKLKKGKGKLMHDIRNAVEMMRENMGDENKDVLILPTVIVYRKKDKKKKKLKMPMAFPFRF